MKYLRTLLPANRAMVLLAGVLLTSCAVNPVTGRRQLSLLSYADEARLGQQADRQIVNQYGLYRDDPKVAEYVNDLGQKLARISHRSFLEFHFRVVDSPVVNAFALPGGYIYVTRGLLAYVNSEAELAGIAGHEIGHVMLVNFTKALPGEKKDADIWLTNFEEAVKRASAEHKLIFMSFSGSDWCKPCIKLTKEVLDSEDFQKYAKETFILLRLDFPRHENSISKEQVKHNEKLAEKYNRAGAFPLILILDSKENVIAKTGYRPGGSQKYVEHLKSLVTENHKTGS